MTYTIGIDFGTESGRALLVDTHDGREVATAVYNYSNGVIDEALPGSSKPLPPDWALQDPNDYIEALKQAVPAVLRQSSLDPADVIGIGIDFTSCTMLPTKQDGTPLCTLAPFRNEDPECRRWRSAEMRARCARTAAECKDLLDAVVRQEQVNEQEMLQKRQAVADRLWRGRARAGARPSHPRQRMQQRCRRAQIRASSNSW